MVRMDRTPWNEEWSESVARVGKLISSLFACQVRFQSIEAFLEQARQEQLFLEQDLVFFHSNLFMPPDHLRSCRPGTIAFPLHVRRQGSTAGSTTVAGDVSLVGVATVERLATSDDQRLTEVGEFLKLAVEAKLDAFERLLAIEQREAQLLQAQTECESKNVIQLFPRAIQKAALSTAEIPLHTIPATDSDVFIFDKPLLIQSSDSRAVERIAVEIFQKTDLWFFVNIEDLHADAFASSNAVRELGRMCIFIRDLATVSAERQIRIAEAFAEHALDSDGPRLIAAITEPLPQLIDAGKVLAHLSGLFKVVQPTAAEIGDSTQRAISAIVNSLSGKGAKSKLIPLWGHRPGGDDRPPTFH